VGGIGGEVSHIGIRATTLRTAEGADVIVPNATFISERVVNWTFSDRRRRVDIDVGVKYGTDPEKVIALLVATGRAHPEVLQIPEPIALLTRFGDNSLDFRLHVWTRFEIFVRVKSELTMAVNAALSGAGMEIPFPQRELHVKVDPGTPTYLLPETTEGD
jgi:small-conductance mechanosensitive channel